MCFRHIRSIMYRSKITLCILDRFWPAQLSNIFELKSEQILFPLNWTGFWIWQKTDPKWWTTSLRRAKEIIGLNVRSLQERLLREPSLDSTKTIDTCRTIEVTRSHAHAIQNGNSLAEFDVNGIRKRSLQHKSQHRTQSSEITNKFRFCSYSHKRASCPAYGKSGNNCKKKEHFSKCFQNFDSKVDFV